MQTGHVTWYVCHSLCTSKLSRCSPPAATHYVAMQISKPTTKRMKQPNNYTIKHCLQILHMWLHFRGISMLDMRLWHVLVPVSYMDTLILWYLLQVWTVFARSTQCVRGHGHVQACTCSKPWRHTELDQPSKLCWSLWRPICCNCCVPQSSQSMSCFTVLRIRYTVTNLGCDFWFFADLAWLWKQMTCL